MNKITLDRIINAFQKIETSEDYIYISRLLGASEVERYLIDNESPDEKIVIKQIVRKVLSNLDILEQDYFFKRIIEKQNERIIAALDDDEKKQELFEKIDDDYKKSVIISSIKDDNIKFKLIEKLKNPYSLKQAIISVKDDELKLKLLNKIENQTYIDEIIRSINDDNIKAMLIMTGKVKDFAYVIKSMQDDQLKIEFLDYAKNLNEALDIIISLNDNNLKIEFLDELEKDKHKCKIILSLKDDVKKVENLNQIKDEFYRSQIIQTLEDDKQKEELLKTIENEENRSYIVQSFENDKLKAKYLEQIKDEILRKRIIRTIHDISVINEIPECVPNDLKRIHNSNINKQEVQSEVIAECDVKYKKIGLDEKITYGIEIESEGLLSKAIKNQKTILENWKIKKEITLMNGVEVVSQVLHDNEQDIKEIYCVNKMLSNSKMEATDNSAAHVHIGADYLKSIDSYMNLFELVGNTERILFQISNPPGSITRRLADTYARPISKELEDALQKGIIGRGAQTANKLIDLIKEDIIKSRQTSVNIMNINGAKNTIEFRMANGTLDPNDWIENIRLYGRIVQRSEELAILQAKPDKTSDEIKMIKSFEKLKQNIPEEEKAEVLFDILFTQEEKETYRKRYEINHEICEELEELNTFKFGIVDFKRQYDDQISSGKDLKKIERDIISQEKQIPKEERIGG